MKKTIITLAVILAGVTGSYAQFEKGRMLVGGSLGFDTQTEKTESAGNSVTNGKTTNFTLDPQFGYFVIDNLAVGAGIGFVNSKFTSDDDQYESTDNGFLFKPFVRYYLPMGVFFQGAYGFGSAKSEETSQGDTDKAEYGLSNWDLAAGYAIFLGDNVAVEPMIGYGSLTQKYKDSDPEVKDISSGLFIKVGFQIYLGGGN